MSRRFRGGRLRPPLGSAGRGLRLLSSVLAAVPLLLAIPGQATMPPIWSWTDEASTRVGERLAGGRDVDGDGWADLLLGAPASGPDAAGEILLFRGGPAAFESTPEWRARGAPGERLGRAVALGDIDGDGLSELIAAAVVPGSDIGRVHIYKKRDSLPSAPAREISTRMPNLRNEERSPEIGNEEPSPDLRNGERSPAQPAWELEWVLVSDAIGDGFGAALAAAELTDDGHEDLLIGAPTYSHELTFEGRVLLFRGTKDGPDPTPSWERTGGSTGAGFGGAILPIPRGDASTCHAILVGSPDASLGQVREGAAWLFASTPSGYELVWSAQGNEPYTYFGYALAAGDLDADGIADLVIGGFGADSGRGMAQLFRGSWEGPETAPSASLTGRSASDYFGVSLAVVNDLDRDRLPELAVGAMGEDASGHDAGTVQVWEWDGGGLSESLSLEGPGTGAFFGTAMCGAGSFCAGVEDGLVAGAPWHAGGSGWIGAYAVVRSTAVAPGDDLTAMARIVPNPASLEGSRIVLGELIVSRIDWVDATGRVLGSIEDRCGLTASIALSRFHVEDPPRRSWFRLTGPWGSRGLPVLLRS